MLDIISLRLIAKRQLGPTSTMRPMLSFNFNVTTSSLGGAFEIQVANKPTLMESIMATLSTLSSSIVMSPHLHEILQDYYWPPTSLLAMLAPTNHHSTISVIIHIAFNDSNQARAPLIL